MWLNQQKLWLVPRLSRNLSLVARKVRWEGGKRGSVYLFSLSINPCSRCARYAKTTRDESVRNRKRALRKSSLKFPPWYLVTVATYRRRARQANIQIPAMLNRLWSDSYPLKNDLQWPGNTGKQQLIILLPNIAFGFPVFYCCSKSSA